jgi:hypothetical protein
MDSKRQILHVKLWIRSTWGAFVSRMRLARGLSRSVCRNVGSMASIRSLLLVYRFIGRATDHLPFLFEHFKLRKEDDPEFRSQVTNTQKVR